MSPSPGVPLARDTDVDQLALRAPERSELGRELDDPLGRAVLRGLLPVRVAERGLGSTPSSGTELNVRAWSTLKFWIMRTALLHE